MYFSADQLNRILEDFINKCKESNYITDIVKQNKNQTIISVSNKQEEMRVDIKFSSPTVKKDKGNTYDVNFNSHIQFLSESKEPTPFVSKIMDLFSESVIGHNKPLN